MKFFDNDVMEQMQAAVEDAEAKDEAFKDQLISTLADIDGKLYSILVEIKNVYSNMHKLDDLLK